MKKLGLSLLLLSSVFASDSYIDKVNNILQDGKNLNFNIKLTHTDAAREMAEDQILNPRPSSTLFGTIGVILFPNSWKLNLSYTGTIGTNVLFKSSSYDSFQSGLDNYTGNYPIDDNEKNTYWIDFYMKPLSTFIGDFGFGYTRIEQSVVAEAFNTSTNPKILNLQGSDGKAFILDDNNKYLKYNTTTSRIFVTYNIPSKNRWYSGLGVSYAYETSNRAKTIQPAKSVVIKPDTTSNIITIGINKTLDEVNTGLSFKTLTYGIVKSEHKYYNYDISQNETYKNDETQIDATLIFMFKPTSNKQFYITGGVLLREESDDASYYSESKLEVGMIF